MPGSFFAIYKIQQGKINACLQYRGKSLFNNRKGGIIIEKENYKMVQGCRNTGNKNNGTDSHRNDWDGCACEQC